MTPYTKPAQSLGALQAKITGRGLVVAKPADLQAALENLGYYRLGGYAYPFLVPPDRKVFKPDTTWEQIARVYEFDRELRLLVNDAVERIEVAFRARLITATTMAWGPHWFLDVTKFHPNFDHGKFLAQLEREVGIKYDAAGQRVLPATHAETFIAHYYTKYGDPYLPPFWMMAEILTLGALSTLYKGLGDPALKLLIAQPFGVTAKVMVSWLHALAHLRNVCAHHGRLWNRVFSISPLVPPHLAGIVQTPNRFEGHAVVLVEMLRVTAPDDDWKQTFHDLLADFPEIDSRAMGFGSAWSFPFWQP